MGLRCREPELGKGGMGPRTMPCRSRGTTALWAIGRLIAGQVRRIGVNMRLTRRMDYRAGESQHTAQL